MKKLLIATDAFMPRWDGIVRFLSETIPKLKEDYDITVLAPRFPEFKDYIDQSKDFKTIRISTYNFKFGDYHPPKFCFRVIKQAVEQADIIWTHAIMPVGMLAIKYAHKMKKPVIAYIHSTEWELALNSLSRHNIFRKFSYIFAKITARLFYNKCTLLMIPSAKIGEKLKQNGVRTRQSIIHMGVNTNKFAPPDNKGLIKKELGINPNNVVIGFSGRLGREKNVVTLYKAFMRLEKKYNNIYLLIVGKGVEDIEKLFSSHKRIKLVKYTNRMFYYLQAMDIYVMPSLTETSSLSTMEAMATGLTVVTTDVGLFSLYIKDRINGCLFPKENDLVLSLKLEWLIKNKEIRDRLGKNARQTMVKGYQWDTTVEKIKRTLKELST